MVSREISYVAARAMALIAKLIDLLKKTAAHRKRPARIIMMIEKICGSMYKVWRGYCGDLTVLM
jgi:hypothetical protein